MLFVFGFKIRRATVEEGTFHCPTEGADRRYERIRARRWFALFFIPVIPLDRQGEHVRCRSCGTAYPPDVTRRHPARGASEAA